MRGKKMIQKNSKAVAYIGCRYIGVRGGVYGIGTSRLCDRRLFYCSGYIAGFVFCQMNIQQGRFVQRPG